MFAYLHVRMLHGTKLNEGSLHQDEHMPWAIVNVNILQRNPAQGVRRTG